MHDSMSTQNEPLGQNGTVDVIVLQEIRSQRSSIDFNQWLTSTTSIRNFPTARPLESPERAPPEAAVSSRGCFSDRRLVLY